MCTILHKLCNFFTQQLVGSYVSQCCVNFLNSGLTVWVTSDKSIDKLPELPLIKVLSSCITFDYSIDKISGVAL